MFGFFKSKPKVLQPSVDEETRQWMENNFLWLLHEFGEEKTITRKIYTPESPEFSFPFDGSEDVAYRTLRIVAQAMEIDSQQVVLDFFDYGNQSFYMGGGGAVFTQSDPDNPPPVGVYLGKDETGKYIIGLDRTLLTKPVELIATLAHELSHVKLLGEQRLEAENNDEDLTDLTTVIFGFGVFNANSAFQFMQSHDSWSYSQSGYLSQMEWGYALALLAYVREEDEEPVWAHSLNTMVLSDFRQSLQFILANKELIFDIDETDEEEQEGTGGQNNT